MALFDLDGTLLDGSGLPAAMRRTADRLAAGLPGVTADALVAANTAVWQRLWPEVEERYMLSDDGAAVGEQAWRETLAAVGVHDDAALRTAIATWVEEERTTFRLFPDVLPALERLAALDVRVGLVTNGAAVVQRMKLEVTGLADRLDPIVISSEAGLAKPHAGIFEVALHRAGLPRGAVVYVGDNLWHDVPGALEAGLSAIWLDRHGVALQPDWPQPTKVIGSLDALLPSGSTSPPG